MSEITPENAKEGMSRKGFMEKLALLAAGLGFGLVELPPIIQPGANATRSAAPQRPAGRPAITPPIGSVKRRG
jgi:hypothetical protein